MGFVGKLCEIKKGDLVFLDLAEQSNGDAYDRTGSVFMIPQDKKQSFLDGLQNGAKTLPIYENGNGKQYQGVVATSDVATTVTAVDAAAALGYCDLEPTQQSNTYNRTGN